MNVYELKFEGNKYGEIVAEEEGLWKSKQMNFDGLPKEGWIPPKMRRYNPLLPKAKFLRVASGAIGCWGDTTNECRDIIEAIGQPLMIFIDNEEACCINITNVASCLDKDKTVWVYGDKTGKPIRIKKFHFKRHLLPEARIFKIPETVRGSIYYYKPNHIDEDDIYEMALGSGSGFRLEPIYSED